MNLICMTCQWGQLGLGCFFGLSELAPVLTPPEVPEKPGPAGWVLWGISGVKVAVASVQFGQLDCHKVGCQSNTFLVCLTKNLRERHLVGQGIPGAAS